MAVAGGWLDDAVSGLAQGPVYVSPDVRDQAGLSDALRAVVPQDGSIGVVVLPADARHEVVYQAYPIDRMLDGSDYDTVVIAIGSDLMAGSRVIDSATALSIANQAEADAGSDLTGALTETVQQIADELPSGAPASPGGDWMLPAVIAGVVVVAAGAGVVAVARRRRRARTPSGRMPARIRAAVERLSALRSEYARRARAGDATAARVDAELARIVANVPQLFARLDAKGGADQRALAENEYADKLGRLLAAVSNDYLLDLLAHPDLWEDPQQRVAEVLEALEAVSVQLVDNIKQVNARHALRFQVSLDSLVGREELRDWERQFRRATDGA
ncbi:hypothetical protein [Microbacterium sp. No. 7]|uniref:hypothetical protein n=1 Tax=Microbacterium sp. No. 7 TaxID=1714373 RepID=UPI0006D1CF0D|nr:hypothetical protein [Microbacterium sp. No. 7]